VTGWSLFTIGLHLVKGFVVCLSGTFAFLLNDSVARWKLWVKKAHIGSRFVKGFLKNEKKSIFTLASYPLIYLSLYYSIYQ